MSFAAAFRQRLPCVGLFACAAAGVLAGRYVPAPGGIFALLAAVALVLAWFRPLRILFPIGVALVFAAAQTWQYRESPATQLAAKLSEKPQTCMATITVLDDPRLSQTSQRCSFPARLRALELGGVSVPVDSRVIVIWNGPPPVYGGEYRIRAAISNCPPQRNPGAFDYTAWLANAGIRSQLDVLRAGDAQLIRVGGNPIVRFALSSRQWVERTISLGIEGTPEATLIRGMTIGDVSDAPDSMKDAFRETGTFHLFSVSGLHVGIVAVMLWAVFTMLGVSQRRSVLAIIPCLFFYALLTGLSAASVRAAIMLSVLAAGLLVDRPVVALNSIGAAGLTLLLWDSSQLFNSGFQLSFGAVAMICLLATPLQQRLSTFAQPDPFIPTRLIPPVWRIGYGLANGATLLIAVSFAAWLASLPLILYYFHLISFSSIPANLLAVPLSSLILALAAVSLVAGAVSPWLAAIFNHTNFLLAKVLMFIVQSFAAIPGTAIYVGAPQPAGTVAEIVVLDARNGGAAALFAGGKTWLIDSGSEFFGDSVALPFLRTSGVNRLDCLVLTHGDAQHIGGVPRIISELKPRRILDAGLKSRSRVHSKFLETTAFQSVKTGASFPLDSSTHVTVLYPPANAHAAAADDNAIVLRFEAGDFSALLMSDAGLETELWLLRNKAALLPCDLVIMGRNRSGFSGDTEFLKAARPHAIIATAAFFPPTEQIRPEWAAAVQAMGIDLLRQDKTGAVTVTAGAKTFTLTPFLSTGGVPRTFSNATDPLR